MVMRGNDVVVFEFEKEKCEHYRASAGLDLLIFFYIFSYKCLSACF